MNDFEDLDVPKSTIPVIPEIKKRNVIPPGYIKLELSTKGKLNVPKEVHVRNFTTGEVLDLSMYQEGAISEVMINVLNRMIYEDTDVADWPEPAVIELIVRIYANFFSPTLKEIPFPLKEEDFQYLRDQKDEKTIKDIKEGRYVPRTDLDITNVVINELSDKVKNYTVIKTKAETPKAYKFKSFTSYGDSIKLEKIISDIFKEKDKEVEEIKNKYEIYQMMLNKGTTTGLPNITSEEFEKLQENELEKLKFTTDATFAFYLVAVDGKDVSSKPLQERIQILNEDPFVDANFTKALDKAFRQINFGIDPEVPVYNPIQKVVSKRKYTFQELVIIQAIQQFQPEDYDISYDD